MIINKGDVFIAESGNLYISEEYVNTDKNSWMFDVKVYENKSSHQVHTDYVKKVFSKEEYPEYYL